MGRVEVLLKDPFYWECVNKNEEKERSRKFCCHSFQHFLDVARITYIMMLESGDITAFMLENDLNLKLAREVIYASALVHDIGRWREYETGEDHSLVSSELAEEILQRSGFNANELIIIKNAVREHRRLTENASLLGKYLHRADNFSRLCTQCGAREECYKINDMETGQKLLVY